MKKIIFACLLCVVLVACSSVEGQWCSISSGKLCCTLHGNPTTGYLWTASIEDGSVLACTEDSYHPSGATGMVGAGGFWVYEFTALSDGETQVEFSYARSWEDKAIETKTISVICNKGKIVSFSEL